MDRLLDLSNKPREPAEALLWLSGVKERVLAELDEEYAEVYARLRRESRLEWAIEQKFHGKKRILALTRWWNQRQGRMVRWGDGLDPTSSRYQQP